MKPSETRRLNIQRYRKRPVALNGDSKYSVFYQYSYYPIKILRSGRLQSFVIHDSFVYVTIMIDGFFIIYKVLTFSLIT